MQKKEARERPHHFEYALKAPFGDNNRTAWVICHRLRCRQMLSFFTIIVSTMDPFNASGSSMAFNYML